MKNIITSHPIITVVIGTGIATSAFFINIFLKDYWKNQKLRAEQLECINQNLSLLDIR